MTNYYIASIKHTNRYHEHITWWGPDSCGYTPVVGDRIGEYDADFAREHNTGMDYIAVPVEAVQALLSAEPEYKPGARFYDQRGPVVENTRENWQALIAASMIEGRYSKPKPVVFTGKWRVINRVPFRPPAAHPQATAPAQEATALAA